MSIRKKYDDLGPYQIEDEVAKDLEAALGKRGGHVMKKGQAKNPDILVDCGDFAMILEQTKMKGAAAASEFASIVAHREDVERAIGKRTHLVFNGNGKTHERMVHQMRRENARLAAGGSEARMLPLSLQDTAFVLDRLKKLPAEVSPLSAWEDWFGDWDDVLADHDIPNDVVCLQSFQRHVLREDDDAEAVVEALHDEAVQRKQEALRRTYTKLENDLRHRNVVGPAALRTLVLIVFVKLFEEKRGREGKNNRFTLKGFKGYRESLKDDNPAALVGYENRTFHLLLKQVAEAVPDIGLLNGFKLSQKVTDDFIEGRVLTALDPYSLREGEVDPLGAVFEAVARRAEKDNRIGQFFTPEPIVSFGTDIAEPGPLETMLDPASGTARFATTSQDRMIARAGEVAGESEADVVKKIREERVIGTDADPWVVTIAQMNLYIHGSDRPNVLHENGLFLADKPGLFNGQPGTLEGQVDVCLTNPPLGDMDYGTYAQDLEEQTGQSASTWLENRMAIVPGEYKEVGVKENAETKRADWKARLHQAIKDDDEKAQLKAERWVDYYTKAIAEADVAIQNGTAEWVPSGNTAKGGALFLAAIADYLDPESVPGEKGEWRGGRVVIVVDEAILNAPEYVRMREFIRERYFVKAVFSFNRDAFWYQARTTAKTSMLYLYRKPDTDVEQQEPILFAHIDKIGFDRNGKPDTTDLPRYRRAYKDVEEAVRESYAGHSFSQDKLADALEEISLPSTVRLRYDLEDHGERLDWAYEAARHVRASLPDDHAVLGDYADIVVRNPEETDDSYYEMATVDRRTGEVLIKGLQQIGYSVRDLRVIEEGDIVLSGIDLVNGSVGYAYADADGGVVSKEFYTLQVKEDQAAEVDPRYLALLLRTRGTRELVAGTVTGTSNRTRVESDEALLSLPLPELPDLDVQREQADYVERSRELRNEARSLQRDALTVADAAWGGEPVDVEVETEAVEGL